MPLPGLDLNDPVHLGITCGAEGQWGHPNTRAGVRLTYSRFHVIPELRKRWAWLVPLLGLTSTSSICLIGCAYGYSLEILAEDFGITRVIGIETASALQTKKAQSEDGDIQAAIESVGLSIGSGDGLRLYTALRDRPGQPRCAKADDVLNEDLSSNASRNRVRQALLGKGGTTWDVITENVCTVLTDAECVTLSARAHQLAGVARVIHLVSTLLPDCEPGQQPAVYNWKTVAQWAALVPADSFVSVYTRAVAGATL